MSIIKDLSNMKFGSLLVIHRNGSTKQGKAKWSCQCECGNIQDFISSNLLNGHSTQCNICAIKMSSEKRKHQRRIPVPDYIKEQIAGEYCDGETISNLSKKYNMSYATIVGWTVNLGVKTQHIFKSQSGYSTAFNLTYKRYKASAKYKNLNFEITKANFYVLTQANCVYCGSAPNSKAMTATSMYIYNGIDRIDSNIGYESNNIVTCCGICNHAKYTLLVTEFESWINRLITFRTEKQNNNV